MNPQEPSVPEQPNQEPAPWPTQQPESPPSNQPVEASPSSMDSQSSIPVIQPSQAGQVITGSVMGEQPAVQPAPVTPADTPPSTESSTSAQTPDAFSSNPFLAVGKGLGNAFSGNPLSAVLINFVWILAFLPFLLVFPLMLINPLVGILGIIVATVVMIIVFLRAYVGMLYIAMESRNGNKTTVRQAIGKGSSGYLTPVVFTAILAGIAIFLGLLLLIIPGLIFMARFSLFAFVIMKEDKKYTAALKRSWALTKGHTIEMFGLIFAGSLLGGNGQLGGIIGAASMEQRYHELASFEAAGTPTGKIHGMNYLIIVLGILVFALSIGLNILGTSLQKKSNDFNSTDFNFESNSDFQFDNTFESSFPSDSSSDFQFDYEFDSDL